MDPNQARARHLHRMTALLQEPAAHLRSPSPIVRQHLHCNIEPDHRIVRKPHSRKRTDAQHPLQLISV